MGNDEDNELNGTTAPGSGIDAGETCVDPTAKGVIDGVVEGVLEEAMDPALKSVPDLQSVDNEEMLESQLEVARREIAVQKDELLRLRAEMENLRKRMSREVENAHKYGLDRFVELLLPVKDSMDLGFAAAETTSDVASIREGVSITLKMFSEALAKVGVSEVVPEGEKFSPELHQAISMQETSDVAPGTVLSIVQRGYVLNDRLIRPAMVVVAKAVAEPDLEMTEQDP